MRNTQSLALALVLVTLGAVPGQAGPLANAGKWLETHLHFGARRPARGQAAVDTATSVTLPRDFFDKVYLFGGMVEDVTDNYLTLGQGAGPYKVHWRLEGDYAMLLLDRRGVVADRPGASEDALNRYPIREDGGNIELDLAHPEVMDVALVTQRANYTAQRPGYVTGLTVQPGYLAFSERYICQDSQPSARRPARLTLGIKYYFRELARSGTYRAKVNAGAGAGKYGYFLTGHTSLSADGQQVTSALVNRWDLSKKIVFTLHPSIPEKYRPACREAVLSWNDVFAATNGVRPIEVRDGTEAEVPADIRSHVIYWVDYACSGHGGITVFAADPDTGELLDADIIFYGADWRAYVADQRKEAASETPVTSGPASPSSDAARQDDRLAAGEGTAPKFELRLGTGEPMQFEQACIYPIDRAASIAAQAHFDISAISDDEAMTRIVKHTIAHEVGHALGLRHNFRASADLQNSKDGEDATSLMDYPVTHLDALTHPGPYDYAAIAYGYDGDKSLYEGKKFLYATDENTAVDPYANRWDTGDPLQFYMGRFDHFKKLRDTDRFDSLSDYAIAQRTNLESIRKFVNRSSVSEKAFEFLIKVATDKAPASPFDRIERIRAMRVLAEAAPAMLTDDPDNNAYAPLIDTQKAAFAAALAKNVAGDGPDDFSVRLEMLDGLKAMGDMNGYKALQGLDQKLKRGSAAATTGDAAGDSGSEELAVRVRQYLASYFVK